MLRFWYDNTGDTTEVFDISGHALREYNEHVIVEVEDANGYIHSIDKSTGNDMQIVAVILSFPAGYLQQENAGTPAVMFKSWLLARYKARTVIEVFDTDGDDDGPLAYKGRLRKVDDLVRSNKTMFSEQMKALAQLRLLLTAEGTYSDVDDLTTASYEARP